MAETHDNFMSKLEQEINEITKNEVLSDVGDGFVFWLLVNYFNLEKDEAHIALTGCSGDESVDAIFELENEIYVIQGKGKESTTAAKIKIFKGCIDWLLNPEECEKFKNEKLIHAAELYREAWEEGKKVNLHYFTRGSFQKDAKRECNVFNKNPNNIDRVQMWLHDGQDINRFYGSIILDQNPLSSESYIFKLHPEEFFERKKYRESVVATINASDLLELYERYRDDLFFRNIRYYLGTSRGKVGDINKNIIQTITEDDNNFWYYNNGLMFVCQNYKITNGSSTEPLLTVEGFQIVNGCQTTVSIYQAKSQLEESESISDNVQVLARFIKAPVLEDVNNITFNTNSQNPVTDRQLKANCPIQKRLQNDFAGYIQPYFYDIKDGDWKRLSTTEKSQYKQNGSYRRIKNDEVAQILHAFNEDPVFARSFKTRVFLEKYNKIFKKDIHLSEILLPLRIQTVIKNKINAFSREFNKMKRNPENYKEPELEEIKNNEFLLYSKFILLYYIGNLIRRKYNIVEITSDVADKLLNNRLEGRINKLLDYIIPILSYSDILTKERNLERLFKNFDRIKDLYGKIEQTIKMESARLQKDVLSDFLPHIRL